MVLTRIINGEAWKILGKLILEEGVDNYLRPMKEKHPDLYEHSERIALLSLDMAIDNGLPKGEMTIIGHAALLHDIGKLKIDEKILYKEGPLTREEIQVMRQHPRLGFVELSDPQYDRVRRVKIAHHEHKANDPYPRSGKDRRQKCRGDERRNYDPLIDKEGQIIAASDIYDALVSKRSYKEALSIGAAEEIMRKQFKGDSKYIDQALKRAFFSI